MRFLQSRISSCALQVTLSAQVCKFDSPGCVHLLSMASSRSQDYSGRDIDVIRLLNEERNGGCRYARWLEEGELPILDLGIAEHRRKAWQLLRSCSPAHLRNTQLLNDPDQQLQLAYLVSYTNLPISKLSNYGLSNPISLMGIHGIEVSPCLL